MRETQGGPRLTRGATVAVVAPSFAVPPGGLDAGLTGLRRRGFHVRVGDTASASAGYLAGDDTLRCRELVDAWLDPSVDAIWLARGGYGATRLLDDLPWRRLRGAPKPLIGYSDATALLNAAWARTGATSLHGPVVLELGDRTSYHAPSLTAGLAGRPWTWRARRRDVLFAAGGRARGPLIGGNLCVYAHLCGTRHRPDPRGAVLLIEEVGEQLYRIDRSLTQLRSSGALRGLAAVLVGRIDIERRKRFPPDRELREVLRETFGPLDVPVLTGLPVGHGAAKRTVPIGATVGVDVDAGRVTFDLPGA